jgi:hypothetical protein
MMWYYPSPVHPSKVTANGNRFRDANQAFANVQNGVDYAQNAKNALLGVPAPTSTLAYDPILTAITLHLTTSTSTSTAHTTTTTKKAKHGKRHHGHWLF